MQIRRATIEDAQRIWEIRNEPASLAVAASSRIIPLADHISWFENQYFKTSGSVCFVADKYGVTVGYCRFDLNEGRYVNSIAITSSMHGQGVGTLLLKESIRLLNTQLSIHAEVRKFNTASIKMFEHCGFKKISEDEKNIYYEL